MLRSDGSDDVSGYVPSIFINLEIGKVRHEYNGMTRTT